AVGRPKPGPLGHLAGRPRRTGAIGPGTPGQRLPRRPATPAGRLADQAGAGAGLQRPGHRPSGARRHPSTGAGRPVRPATPTAGRTGLGAIAAMSLPTLHDFHRPLGSTGFKVSPLGLGTVKLGRDQGVKYPTGFTIPGDDDASLLLAQARELGINLIDTAPAYGRSEERLGPLLRGQRDEWVIVSKVGEEF